VASCITFVILCNFDWSTIDPCCSKVYDKYGTTSCTEILLLPEIQAQNWNMTDITNDTCLPIEITPGPLCNEFFYSRMPIYFEWSETVIGVIYLINYVIILFIAQNRFLYFISISSIKELVIIVPIFIFDYGCNWIGLLFKGISRMLRISKCDIFIKSKDIGEE